MSASFATGATTITPILVDGFNSDRDSRTLVHAIIGTSTPAVAVQDAGLRTGNATLLFPSLEDAQDAEDSFKLAAVWTYTDPDHAGISMSFVITGQLHTELESQSRDLGIVTFGYQEVVS